MSHKVEFGMTFHRGWQSYLSLMMAACFKRACLQFPITATSHPVEAGCVRTVTLPKGVEISFGGTDECVEEESSNE